MRSRSCADQLFGDQNRHKEVRRNAVRYMITHKDDFVPFMDKDREPFDMVGEYCVADSKYIRRMMNNCTWGGDLEINAISNCYKCNVIVYQDRRPNIELQTFPDRDRVMRLAYFGSCHYESVRGHNYKSLSAESLPGTVVLRPDSVKRKEVEGEGRNMMVGEGRNVIAGEGKKALTNHGKKELPSERRIESTVIRRIVPVTDGKESAAGTKQIATDKKEESLKQKSSIAVMETSKESISQLSKPFRPLSKEEIAERNEHIIRHMEKRFNKKQKHHHHREGEWCGDLPFDQLVTPEMQERLKLVPRKNQLLKTLRFLTMKCGCHSGSYFKYCCFPKMKAW